MSDEPTERDVEALSVVLRRTASVSETWVGNARAILRSDWYRERITEARREGAAEAWNEGWHAAAQIVELEGRPVWAHTVMPEGYEGNPYRGTVLRGDA